MIYLSSVSDLSDSNLPLLTVNIPEANPIIANNIFEISPFGILSVMNPIEIIKSTNIIIDVLVLYGPNPLVFDL